MEQSFSKRDFKLAKQRCKACTWGGVRAKLKILFANSAEHFYVAGTFTGGGVILRKGINRGLWAAEQPEAFL